MFFFITLVALCSIPFWRLFNLLFIRTPEPTAFRIGVRIYGWIMVRLVPFMAPVQLRRKCTNFPKAGIVVANHLSSADPYCFGVLPGEYAFMTSWPFKIPFYNWAMNKAQYLDISKGWLHLSTKGKQLLEQGCSLIIWPEGHRSRDGRLSDFQNGAFRIACETGYPIIPVCIRGTNTLMPPGHFFLKPAKISLTILPACYPESTDSPRQCMGNLKDKVWNAIASELDTQQPSHA